MPVVQCFFSAARTKLHEKYDYPDYVQMPGACVGGALNVHVPVLSI